MPTLPVSHNRHTEKLRGALRVFFLLAVDQREKKIVVIFQYNFS